MRYANLHFAAIEMGYDNGCFNRTSGYDVHEQTERVLSVVESKVGVATMHLAEAELVPLTAEAIVTSCCGEGGESSLKPKGCADIVLNAIFEEL